MPNRVLKPVLSARPPAAAQNAHSSSQANSTSRASAHRSPWRSRVLAAAGVTVIGAAAGGYYILRETRKAVKETVFGLMTLFSSIGQVLEEAIEAFSDRIYRAATLRDKDAVDELKWMIAQAAKEDYRRNIAQALKDTCKESDDDTGAADGTEKELPPEVRARLREEWKREVDRHGEEAYQLVREVLSERGDPDAEANARWLTLIFTDAARRTPDAIEEEEEEE